MTNLQTLQTVNFLENFLKTRYCIVSDGLVVTNKQGNIKLVVNVIHNKESDVLTYYVQSFKKTDDLYLKKSSHHLVNCTDNQVYISEFIGEMCR